MLRNKTNYDEDISINNITLTGLKELCVFNQINSFHAAQNFAIDIMHDILEGMILKNMIYDFNYFTIDTLNNRIEYFNYGSIDIRNRPPLLSTALLKNGLINMSASEMLCFTKYFALIIGDLVPLNSEIWCLYISLRQIIGFLLEKSIKYDDIDLCKTLITEHHELYMNLFNTNLIPKFHHMVHYPMIIKKCGPLSLIWSMRFELKHKELKETAKSITSRKNACYTLALKHQLNVAYRILSTKNKLIINSTKLGRHISINESKLTQHNNSEFLNNSFNFLTDNISFVSWINFKGTLYNYNNMSVLLQLSEDPYILPIFGLILSLFITQDDNEPFIVCNVFVCNYFNKHLQSYNVTLTSKLVCCCIENLNSVHPTVCQI